jgi:hypothetical protein
MTRVSDPEERKTRARLVTREFVATCTAYLEKFFSSFSRKIFMNNPNPTASPEAPKTAPQSDNKPNPQQQQGQGDNKQDSPKPDQQQQK